MENYGEIRNDKNSERGSVYEVRRNYFSVVTIVPVSITFLITYQIRRVRLTCVIRTSNVVIQITCVPSGNKCQEQVGTSKRSSVPIYLLIIYLTTIPQIRL
jgi:hypothetical protein